MSQEYEVRLLSIAEQDLADIITYIADENPTAAKKLLNKIEKNLANLSKFPFLGKESQDEPLFKMGYRYYIVDNYVIFYTVGEKSILIHRIIHGARDYKAFL